MVDKILSDVAKEIYIGAAQFEYWEHTQLVIDVVPRTRLRLLARSA